MLRKTFAALGVAAITVLATPVAASAAPSWDCSGISPDYASAGFVTADQTTINPGDSVTVNWQGGYFAPGSTVSVGTSGSGANGSQVAGSGVADGSGNMTATVTAGSSAVGSMVISGASDCATGGVTVTVLDNGAASTTAATPSLAFTGSTVPVVLVLSGAGALAFGTILLVARARTRRRLQQ